MAENLTRLRTKFERLYRLAGALGVQGLANKMKLPYSPCIPCEQDTPTIGERKPECAICGTPKQKPPYKSKKGDYHA